MSTMLAKYIDLLDFPCSRSDVFDTLNLFQNAVSHWELHTNWLVEIFNYISNKINPFTLLPSPRWHELPLDLAHAVWEMAWVWMLRFESFHHITNATLYQVAHLPWIRRKKENLFTASLIGVVYTVTSGNVSTHAVCSNQKISTSFSSVLPSSSH